MAKTQKKYKFTKETINHFGHTLHRICATRDFGDVKKGELGGFVESKANLSHEDNCWVYDNARVYGNAKVSGDAKVFGNARVYSDAWVYGNARVFGN